MTQTQDQPTLLIPARCRELPAVPVLIRVPMVAGGPRAPHRRTRRRRLRREVRVAAFALLSAFPFTMGFLFVGGDRPGTLAVAATSLEVSGGDEPTTSLPITLEPVVSISAQGPDLDVPVVLPGYLLPADLTEEVSDGGY